jgi:hypothetical protein
MPTGTIKQVYQVEGNKKPGAVVFTDGQRFSTFDRPPIAAATGNEGQLAEYTTEQNGKYTNLKTLRVLGAGAGAQQSAPRGEVIDLGTEKLTRATQDVAAAVREFTALYARLAGAAVTAMENTRPTPSAAAVDDLVAYEAALAASPDVGPEAAAAMFVAVRKAKDPLAKAKAVLAANGVEAP